MVLSSVGAPLFALIAGHVLQRNHRSVETTLTEEQVIERTRCCTTVVGLLRDLEGRDLGENRNNSLGEQL